MPMLDYRCAACGGEFEANFGKDEEKVCVGCGGEISVIWLKAPGIIEAGTKHTDKTMDKITKEFGLTDFSNSESRAKAHQTPRKETGMKWAGLDDFKKEVPAAARVDAYTPVKNSGLFQAFRPKIRVRE